MINNKTKEPTLTLTIQDCIGLEKLLRHEFINYENEEAINAYKKIEQFLDSLANNELAERSSETTSGVRIS